MAGHHRRLLWRGAASSAILALWATGLGVEALRQASREFIGIGLDEDGTFTMEDGEKVKPWDGLEPEADLPDDAFTCLNGLIFGIRVPAMKKGKKKTTPEKFHYVTLKPAPAFWPVQIYFDTNDPRNQFYFYPPIDGVSETWRLHFRWADRMGPQGHWSGQRLFEAGEEHPCGPEGDWEVQAEIALATAAMRQLPSPSFQGFSGAAGETPALVGAKLAALSLAASGDMQSGALDRVELARQAPEDAEEDASEDEESDGEDEDEASEDEVSEDEASEDEVSEEGSASAADDGSETEGDAAAAGEEASAGPGDARGEAPAEGAETGRSPAGGAEAPEAGSGVFGRFARAMRALLPGPRAG